MNFILPSSREPSMGSVRHISSTRTLLGVKRNYKCKIVWRDHIKEIHQMIVYLQEQQNQHLMRTAACLRTDSKSWEKPEWIMKSEEAKRLAQRAKCGMKRTEMKENIEMMMRRLIIWRLKSLLKMNSDFTTNVDIKTHKQVKLCNIQHWNSGNTVQNSTTTLIFVLTIERILSTLHFVSRYGTRLLTKFTKARKITLLLVKLLVFYYYWLYMRVPIHSFGLSAT